MAKFCDGCGQRLAEVSVETENAPPETESERKHVTALFFDLSGYTTMSEKLDPEELKEIMSRVFGEIAQVVTKYEGFIEQFVGDAVMGLFGLPNAHEDDPISAIKVAREIHKPVDALSHEVEKRIGQEVVKYSENFGAETLGIPANVYLGIVSISKGYMSRGLKMIEESLQLFQENERKSAKAIVEYALGKVYFQIFEECEAEVHLAQAKEAFASLG